MNTTRKYSDDPDRKFVEIMRNWFYHFTNEVESEMEERDSEKKLETFLKSFKPVSTTRRSYFEFEFEFELELLFLNIPLLLLYLANSDIDCFSRAIKVATGEAWMVCWSRKDY